MKTLTTKILNNTTNSLIGNILIIIIPTVIFYYGIIKEFVFNTKITKMEITVALLVGYSIFSIFKTWDLKNKIIALKEFRDYETISIINFYNSEIKKLNDRLLETEKKLKIPTYSEFNENEKRLFHEEAKSKEKIIIEYNSMFETWKCGNYGKETSSSFYKKLNYEG
ncbi:hypothetical protein [Confluentibacter sediminis]|uniref:hypothetical protein n=1 Tax=Confluentibacter sediminis TaxID=2219045 RepID=UPI000DAD376F|nr:hypothetical protein [Confluentibacter sediminis]